MKHGGNFRRARHAAILALVVVLFLLPACGGSAGAPAASSSPASEAASPAVGAGAAKQAAKIGVAFTLSGANANYGLSQRKGAQLAADEINASGYIPGVDVNLLISDDGGTPESGTALFQKFLNDDKELAIIGPTLSNVALKTDPLAQQAKTPVLAVSNTVSGITDIGDDIFRDSLSEAQVIPQTIKVSKAKLGYKKVALMYGNDETFSTAGYQLFKQALTTEGVAITTEQPFGTNDQDFKSQLSMVKASNPEAIVVSALSQPAVKIMTQARELGLTRPIIGGNGFNSTSVLHDAGAAAEGVIVGAAWNIADNNAKNLEFVKNFRAKYNEDPDQFAAQAYTGVYLMAEAIKRAGTTTDHVKLRDALAGIRDFPTALGTFSFSPNGDAEQQPVIQIVKDGKFVPLS